MCNCSDSPQSLPRKILPKPAWIRAKAGQGTAFETTRVRLQHHGLHTVCEEALCPNRGRCWSNGRATIMILGDRCTRGCRFCNVDKKHVNPPEYDEPERVAAALRETGLREVVLTSVTRDDLPDGGAAHWAHTIRAVRNTLPDVLIEVLIPDFGGNSDALELVIAEHPDVMGHNLETVPRLYPSVRPEAGFERSLHVLRQSHAAGLITKTSLMLGLGETMDEIRAVLQAARRTGCQIFYAGQYLQPSTRHTPVVRYLTPAEFDEIGAIAKALGFGFVSSAPLVRSSYHEDGQSEFVRQLKCKKSFA